MLAFDLTFDAPSMADDASKPDTPDVASGVGRGAGDIAVLAHDIRGPLANLSLLIEAMAQDERKRGAGTASVQRSDKALLIIERLDGMLTAMLDRSRQTGSQGEPGSMVVEPADVDIVDLVETMVSLNRPMAGRGGVRVACICADPLVARGDAHLIMQAVDNLLVNAIGFTRTGGRVVCEAGPADNGDVLISITDQGPGLAASDLRRVFEPYSKVASPSERPRRSNGLGLSIVQQIAVAHGGSVVAQSRGRGFGATFTLRLPRARAS